MNGILLTASLTIVAFTGVSQVVVPYHGGNPFFGYAYIPKTVVEKNSNVYPFTIVYKDSTRETYKSKIDLYKKTYYLSIDQQGVLKSVQPSETISISRTTKNGEIFTGIATDSCWLFKIKASKINLYSVLAETKMKFVVAVQERDGDPILPITQQNLEAIIPKNSNAQMALRNGDLIKAIEIYNDEK